MQRIVDSCAGHVDQAALASDLAIYVQENVQDSTLMVQRLWLHLFIFEEIFSCGEWALSFVLLCCYILHGASLT